MSIRLVTLGPSSCFLDETPTDLPAHKLRFALLVYIVLQKRSERATLARVFWPERDEERARHALSQALYELRRLLGDEWLESTRDSLEVRGFVSADTAELEGHIQQHDFERAIDLYHGDFLADFHLGKASTEFEAWIEEKRRALKRLHRRACRDRISVLLTQNELPRALELAHKWAALDPLDDEANQALLHVLAQSERRAEVIRDAEVPHSTVPRAPVVVPRLLTRPVTTWTRLKQSRIARTAAVYTASTFLIISFFDVMVPALRLPALITTVIAAIALVGFPIAILVAWAFDDRDESSTVVEPSSISDEPPPHFRRQRASKLRRRAVIVTGFAMVVSVVLLYSAVGKRDVDAADELALDSTLYVVLPFTYGGGVRDSLNEDLLVRDAISRWDGVAVVEPLQVHEALARMEGPLDTDGAAALTRAYGSARFLRGQVTPVGDSLRIQTTMYDASARRPVVLTSVQRRVTRAPGAVEKALAEMVEEVLLSPNRKASVAQPGGSYSVPARRAFAEGLEAMRAWDLQRADSQFERAAAFDEDYGRARLWLGLIRSWARTDTALWRPLARRVLQDSADLSTRETALANALLAISTRDFAFACSQYRDLANRQPYDFVAWYALADCLSRDHVVVRDPASRSGWSFRSSYHSAAMAYRRAYELFPSMHKALAPGSFENVRRVLKTSATSLRRGYALEPDTLQFESYAGFRGDTLEFVPIPTQEFVRGYRADPAELERAVRHQRAQFYSLATTWTHAFPASAEALQAVALALAMLDDETAIDSLRKARTLATTDELQFNIAIREVEANIKFGFPSDVRRLRRARALADSLVLDETVHDFDPVSLASLALLTGRGELAVHLMRSRRAQQLENFPIELGDAGLALTAYAAIGGPEDSIRALDSRFRARLRLVPSAARTFAFIRGYARPAIVTFPDVVLSDLPAVAPLNLTAAAQHAFSQGDRSATRSQLNRIMMMRRGYAAEDLSLDAVHAEAMLLLALGEPKRALAWLDPSLRSIRRMSPNVLLDPVVTASMLRGAVLAAELARTQGQSDYARQLASAVAILLEDADPLMEPLAERAKFIVYTND